MSDHIERGNGWELTFWARNEDGHSVGGTRDDACAVEISSGPMSSRIRYIWPDEKSVVERLCWLLERAFQSGDWQARYEIRKALGVKEAR